LSANAKVVKMAFINKERFQNRDMPVKPLNIIHFSIS